MLNKVSDVSPVPFSPENPALLARDFRKALESFAEQLHSLPSVDFEKFANTVESLNTLSQQAEKC